MYVRRRVIERIGLLDERYPMAYEDVDWCLRAWDAGMTVAYEPSATLIHHESKTRGTDQGERELRSQRVFWERWGGWFDGRRVRTDDGRLRVAYVTEDTGVGGGHRVAFEHLNRLAARGHECVLYSLTGPPDWFDLQVPTRTFDGYDEIADALAELDAIKVATWWRTAAPVWLASVRRGVPVYLVQDIETSYYPRNPELHADVLASYREEHRYLTTSGWVEDRLREMNLDPVAVAPGVDLGVTGAEGLDDETIRLFKQPLADGTLRSVQQTLWDLMGDLETKDLKASGGKTTRFKLTEVSFKRLRAAGVPGVHAVVRAENARGRRFFERLGFQVVGSGPALRLPGERAARKVVYGREV